MQRNPPMITAIDVGTTKVCTIVGVRPSPGRFRVLAHCTVPSAGLQKGNVTDGAAVSAAIRSSLDQVSQQVGSTIETAFVGVTGAHLSFENRRSRLKRATDADVVTARDLDAMSDLPATDTEPGRKLLHVSSMGYAIDGDEEIRHPLGMHAQRLEVDTHVVTGDAEFVQSLVSAVEGAGIQVAELVLEPLASGEAVLTEQERESGAIVVDIGGGTTDIVAYQNGSICYTAIIPVGGFQFTNDIVVTYDAPYGAAEAVKLTFASTDLTAVGSREEITLSVTGRNLERRVLRRDICQLARERALELIGMIDEKIREADIGSPGSVPVVVTGGASNLPGLEQLMRQYLTYRVRKGVPNDTVGLPQELRNPSSSTAVGILLWALGRSKDGVARTPSRSRVSRLSRPGFLARTFRRIRDLLPTINPQPKQGRN